MGLLASINPEQVTALELAHFAVRHAARAVVFDAAGRMALLEVSMQQYHKLPGGGVEVGEDIVDCLRRECLEEIGCHILLGDNLGEVHEYRRQFSQHQISYCFTANVDGEKGQPNFTPAEKAEGFSLRWCTLVEAQMILQTESPVNYVGNFMVARDLAILRAVNK